MASASRYVAENGCGSTVATATFGEHVGCVSGGVALEKVVRSNAADMAAVALV
jgi:hypothetical protein